MERDQENYKTAKKKRASSTSGYDLQMFIDAIPFYVMLVDAEHNILVTNEAIRKDLGLDPEQIIGGYCPKVVHGRDDPYPGCPLEEALEEGQNVEREFFDPETDRWLSSAIYSTDQQTQNGIKIFLHFIIDITERKLAEEEIRKNYDIQSVINTILHLSLEDIPLEEILQRTLDLILTISWLGIEYQGGIFLVEDEPEFMVLKAQSGLSKMNQELCARIPFGKCLCGQAALTQELRFAERIDDRHEIRYEGISSHGHYCIPIIFAGKTLGVINLYLREGYQPGQKEKEFLEAIANVLAGIIERKQMDQALQKSYEEKAFIHEVFGTYLSDEVASEILRSPDGVKLGGEMREMTVLVSDLRGFAAASQSLEPSQVVNIINRYLGKMVPIIMQHEGTIDEFTGDGVLAFFGAPRFLSDHISRAVSCALKMQESMQKLNEENLRLALPQLGMGIGINSGQLVVGNIGSERRKKYGAVGTPINVAFRLQQKARPGEVLVTEEIKSQLGGALQIGSQWKESLKGVGNTLIYEVIGMKEK